MKFYRLSKKLPEVGENIVLNCIHTDGSYFLSPVTITNIDSNSKFIQAFFGFEKAGEYVRFSYDNSYDVIWARIELDDDLPDLI